MKTLPELPSAVTGGCRGELADPNGFSEEDENASRRWRWARAGSSCCRSSRASSPTSCSTLISGGTAACAAQGRLDGARTVGSTTLQAVDKVKELDEEYKVLDKAKKLIDDAIEGGKKLLEGGD